MRKFKSSHQRLEVIQKSHPQVVYLNHQIILLLSNLGVPDEVFMKLQRDMLHSLAGEAYEPGQYIISKESRVVKHHTVKSRRTAAQIDTADRI